MIISKRLIVHSIFIFLLAACGQSSNDGNSGSQFPIPEPEIYSFSFLTAHNPELSDDIAFSFDSDNNTFSGVIPQNTSVKNLIATFQFSGSKVEISGVSQISGNTENDFTQILNYEVYSNMIL